MYSTSSTCYLELVERAAVDDPAVPVRRRAVGRSHAGKQDEELPGEGKGRVVLVPGGRRAEEAGGVRSEHRGEKDREREEPARTVHDGQGSPFLRRSGLWCTRVVAPWSHCTRSIIYAPPAPCGPRQRRVDPTVPSKIEMVATVTLNVTYASPVFECERTVPMVGVRL